MTNTLALRYNYDGDMNWFVSFDLCESSEYCISVVNNFGVYRNDDDNIGGNDLRVTGDDGKPYKLKESYFRDYFRWDTQREIYDYVGENILNKLKTDIANAAFWQNIVQSLINKVKNINIDQFTLMKHLTI